MNRIQTFLACFMIVLLMCGTAYSRYPDLKFERIGIEQGLSDSRILSIIQDRKGFMWFGTSNGLNKYDGYNFTVYKSDPDDPESLSHNYVFSISEDSAGGLWFGTFGGGLNKFNQETETFTRYLYDPVNPETWYRNFIRRLYVDHAGVLWVGFGGGGIARFDREKEIFTHYRHDPDDPNSLSADDIYAFYEAPDEPGVLWIGTGQGGLNKFDQKTETFTRFEHDPGNPNSVYAYSKRVWAIHEDPDGMLWIGTDTGLYKFDRETETFTRFLHHPNDPNSLSHNVVWSICGDRTGALWIGTGGGGLNMFDRQKETFTHYEHVPGNPNSLSYDSVGPFFEDRSGILWFGSWGGGLNKLDRGREQFTHHTADVNTQSAMSKNWVSALYEDRAGVLWIGTKWNGQLTKFERRTGTFTSYRNDPANPNSLSSNFVSSICEDYAGILWVGTGDGLNKFDAEKEIFTRYQHDPDNPNSLGRNSIATLYEDRSGVLWIGTDGGGLNKFDRETEAFTRYKYDPENPNSINSNWVWALYEDRDGVLWVGVEGGGLNRFDRERETFTHYMHDPDNPNSLGKPDVYAICEDRDGTLWVGTAGGGLSKFDRETGSFRHYREKDGLPDNFICGILEDDHGYLWISTRGGMCRMNPRTAEFREYHMSDGLQNRQFSYRANHKSRRTGEMFFGGINGFNTFHPDSVRDNPHIPPVVITTFQRYRPDEAEGKTFIQKGISQKKELNLSYKDKVFAFEFAALNFRNPNKNQYAYKLEGFNNNWIELGTKRDVTFTNLDPGEYTLRVKGSNNDGVWNEAGVSLVINISPPWWRTKWAYGLYVLFIITMLYGSRRYEMKRIELRNELKIKNIEAEKLLEVDHLKSRFFAGISHEFRTPLTLILGPVEKWLAKIQHADMKADFRIVRRNARRLEQLINQLLDLAKLEAGKLDLKARPENIVHLLRMNTMTFKSLAKQKDIDLRFEAQAEEIIAYVEREKLDTILTNLLANAFKFTARNGRIVVSVTRKSHQTTLVSGPGDMVQIRVSDTGMGIPADQLGKIFERFYQVAGSANLGGTGIGLAMTRELVELHHGEIYAESELGCGATFIVTLPLGKAHLSPEEIAPGAPSVAVVGQDEKVEAPGSEQPVAKQEEAATAGQYTVLIVEDNPDMRAYMLGYLQDDYTLIEAEDGQQGLRQAFRHAPDLIISDVMMPEMDGFALCGKLKTDARTSHIPVILLTARASGESKVEGLETGADDYLTKPFEVKELQVRVRNLIEQRRRLQERFRRELLISPSEVTVTSMDEVFLQKVLTTVEAHIDEPDFDTDDLARLSGVSRRQLNRKLRALTGQSVRGFIRTVRLKRAARLLQQQAGTVTEIAYEVGFNSLAHFAKIFRRQFGVAPSEYGRENPTPKT